MPIYNPGGSGSLAIGTTPITGATGGALLLAGAGGVLDQDAADLWFNKSTSRLSIANNGSIATSQTALGTGDYLTIGLGGVASSATNRTTIVFNNQGGSAAPVAPGSLANGDKLMLWNDGSSKAAIGHDWASCTMWFQLIGNVTAKYKWYLNNTGVGNIGMVLDNNRRLCLANDAAIATSQTAYATGDYLTLGLGGVVSSDANKTTAIFNNQGRAAPSAQNATSAGDKLVFWNAASAKTAIGLDTSAQMWFQSTAAFKFYVGTTERFSVGSADSTLLGNLGINGATTFGSGTGVLSISNASVIPTTNITGGGMLYSNAGALTWRGAAGTITAIAPS